MSNLLTFDARGRVTIPARYRKALGKRVIPILTPDGVLLRRVPRHVEVPAPAEGISGEDAALGEV